MTRVIFTKDRQFVQVIGLGTLQFDTPRDLLLHIESVSKIIVECAALYRLPPRLTMNYEPLSWPMSDKMRAWLKDKRNDQTHQD